MAMELSSSMVVKLWYRMTSKVELSDGGKIEESDGGKIEESDGGQIEESDNGKVELSDGGRIEKSEGGKIEKSNGGKIEESDGGHIVKSVGVKAVDKDSGNTMADTVKQPADQPLDPVKTSNTVESTREKSGDVEPGVPGSTDGTKQDDLHLTEPAPTGIPLPPNACPPPGISPAIQDWKSEMLSPPPPPFMTMPPRPTGVVGGPGALFRPK